MNDPKDKMTVDEHGTVTFDFTDGFDGKDLLNVLQAANEKAAEHYRANDPHAHLRQHAANAVTRYREKVAHTEYASMPGAIVHADGVIELPS